MTPGIIEATWAQTLPDAAAGEESWYFCVGRSVRTTDGKLAPITRITVQTDEPGPHRNMRRVCIWTGDTLAAEFPFIAAGAVGYV